MEVPGGHDRKPLVAAYELIGTALFVYIIIVSTGNAMAVPLGLFAMIIIFGGVTGGHFNPAVTVGVYIHEGKWKENALYAALIAVAQQVGALLGMAMATVALHAEVDDTGKTVPAQYVPILAPTDPNGKAAHDMGDDGFSEDVQTMMTQTILTFVFVAVILMLKGGKTAPSKDGAMQALTVALTLGGLIQVANHHAASFNPAVTVGLTVMQTTFLDNEGGYLTHYFYAYYLGPLLGGVLAGLFSRVHNPLVRNDAPKSSMDNEEEATLLNEQTI